MLERIGRPEFQTISTPNAVTLVQVHSEFASRSHDFVIAEIGVGVGATTLELARLLNNKGELHLYDFEENVEELRRDLNSLGFSNIKTFGNSRTHWDSYHWSLAKLLRAGVSEIYDYIYLDGAHTLLHDGLAFFMSDRLLKTGAIIDFDDYSWRFADSLRMRETRHEFMTQEQIDTYQIKIVVDLFVKSSIRYMEVIADKVYRKLSAAP